nr:hypothetical protein [uncultured Fusobacterium sp.]
MIINNNKNTGDIIIGNKSYNKDKNFNGTIIINGKEYHGKNIVIENNNIYVDGEKIEPEQVEEKNIIIEKIENIQYINVATKSGDIVINGDCHGSCQNMSGNITVKGNVSGNCKTMSGNITVKENVSGSCSTFSGNIINK